MLIKEVTENQFDTETVKRGQLISARHRSWTTAISGMIARVLPDQLWVEYLPSIHNVKNCYVINADELDEEWEVRYSADGMKTVETYPLKNNPGEDHLEVGSVVTFKGGNQCYTFYDDDAVGITVSDQGKVKVVDYMEGKAHPYCVITRNWKTCKANGWVDRETLRTEE